MAGTETHKEEFIRVACLGYLMEFWLILDATFSETLATHHGAMLDACLELPKLNA